MPTIIRSGSKVCVIGGAALLAAIARIDHTVVVVGNQYFPAHVTFSEKFWWAIHQLIHGW